VRRHRKEADEQRLGHTGGSGFFVRIERVERTYLYKSGLDDQLPLVQTFIGNFR
jgi:hypothetical protein